MENTFFVFIHKIITTFSLIVLAIVSVFVPSSHVVKQKNQSEALRKAIATISPTITATPTKTNPTYRINTPTLAAINSDYATIIQLSDSKGNVERMSDYNQQLGTWNYSSYPVLKSGETVTITVSVNNTVANPVQYEFNGRGFPNVWQKDNKVTITIDPKIFNLQREDLRVFVKNSDNKFRAPDFDDMIQVFYIIQ